MMRFVDHHGFPRRLPAISLGTMHMSPAAEPDSFALLDAYAAAGGDALDTAQVYGNGDSERCIGKWIKARGNRHSLTVITKGCHPQADGRPRVTPEAIREDIAGSLARLGSSSIDLWLFHRDDEGVPVGELMDACHGEVMTGRIRAVGASNWTWRRISEANDYARRNGKLQFCLSSINLALVSPQRQVWAGCLSADGEALRWHESAQFPLLSWSPQARGLFNPRYEQGAPLNEELSSLYGYPEAAGRLSRTRELARRRGCPAVRVALAWVLARPFPVSAVIGPRNPGQLADSLSALDLELAAEELGWLERG